MSIRIYDQCSIAWLGIWARLSRPRTAFPCPFDQPSARTIDATLPAQGEYNFGRVAVLSAIKQNSPKAASVLLFVGSHFGFSGKNCHFHFLQDAANLANTVLLAFMDRLIVGPLTEKDDVFSAQASACFLPRTVFL